MEGSQNSDELRSTFASTLGGVITEEAGAVTGELELLTRPGEGSVDVLVRYAGADEWYTVAGSPVASEDHQATHQTALERLTTPGPIESGNESPVGLVSS